MRALRRFVFVAALAGAGAAAAQNVTLNGALSDRIALLVIDGIPRSVAVGQTVKGVTLLSIADGEAKVEVGGRRIELRIGAAPVSLASAVQDGNGTRIIMTAERGGHFLTGGTINGRTVQFLVDTGATLVAMGPADAERIGIKYKAAPRAMVHTANGTVAVHRVMLDTIRVGDVEVYGVEAVVVPSDMPHILLGNSFLTRFQMKRENDRLTLSKRM